MKKPSTYFFILAFLLSNIMSATVAYNYCAVYYAGLYEGASAPPEVAFIFLIPFIIAIAICVIIGLILKKKNK